jgi:endonuclease YncB( thermonuclease family)
MKELKTKFQNDKASRNTFCGKVKRVVDGDTFILEGREQSVRLKGINSPEMSNKPYGDDAKKCMEEIVSGETVYIKSTEYQSASSRGNERIVAMVYSSNKVLINAEIVRRGWAFPEPEFFDIVPYDEAIEIDAALKYARSNKMGLWAKDPNNKLLEPFQAVSPTNLDPIDRLEEYRNIPGATRIGTMWLYVPPAQITVTEYNSNIEWPTVRTPGSPRLRSTQQEQRIEMAVIFPNLWSVNYQLRPLIAQFIRSPFLPLENDHVRNIVMPSYLNTAEGLDEQLGNQANITSKSGNLINTERNLIGSNIDDIKPFNRTSLASTVRPKPSSTKIDDRQLFVALRNLVITTIPGSPEAIQATFTMTVFNYLPHMEKVEYLRSMPDLENQLKYLQSLSKLKFTDTTDQKALSAINNPGTTTDASKSEPFKRYYKTLLAETQLGQTSGPISWIKGMMPRLLPLQTDTLNKIQFRLPVNTLTAEEVALNNEEITSLQSYIESQIRMSIKIDSSLYDDTVGQLGKSATAVANILTSYLSEVTRSAKNMEMALSDVDSFMREFEVYLDANSTELLTSIKSTRLSGTTSAKEFLEGAIKGTLNNTDGILKAMKRIVDIQKKNIMGTEGKEMVVDIQNSRNTVITGMSATYSPIAVTVPIVDHLLPSMQFLGKSDWFVSINLMTCDTNLVRQLSSMSQMARVSQLANERSGIRWFMVKLNSTLVPILGRANGLFSFLGVGRVLFEDCVYDTIKEKPGWFNVSLRLTQSDLDITEYEKIIPVNQLDPAIVKSIMANIASGTIRSTKSPYVKKLFSSIQASFKGAMSVMSSLSLTNLTEEDINELANKPEIVGQTMKVMDSPEAWRTHIMKLIGPLLDGITKEDITRATGRTLAGFNPITKVAGEIAIRARYRGYRDSGTPFALDERIASSRVIFQQGVNAAIITSIALDPAGMLEIYDPSMSNATEKERLQAIKALTFSSDRRRTSPLHGCYPDMELPTYAADPLIVCPDFFYKKEERIAPSAVEFVRNRLKALFDKTSNTMREVRAGNSSGARPGDLIGSIRQFALYKKLRDLPEIRTQVDNLQTSTGVKDADDIYKVVKEILSNGGVQTFINQPSEEELMKTIDELEANEYATASTKEQVSMYRVLLAIEIATLQDMIHKGKEQDEAVANHLLKRRNSLLEEFNAIPKYINVGGLEAIQNVWGVSTPSSIKRSQLFMSKAAESRVQRSRSEEISGSLARVYPTFKIYFIEEDPHEWQLFDDYYDYSSVRSVQVVKSKDSASHVATIQISNITQRLSDGKPGLSEVPGHDQTPEEQTISSFLLREGCTIMVRMGYSNDPQLLDRTFMGKIISVSAGDTIQIVAQSFGAELTSPVFEGNESTFGYLSTIKSHGDIVSYAMSSLDGLDHFGNRNMLEIFRVKDPTFSSPSFEGMAYSNPKYRRWDYYTSLISPIKKLVKFGVYDPRFENIYLPFSGTTVTPIIPTLLTVLKRFGAGVITPKGISELVKINHNATFDWYCAANTTLWNLLNEIALYYDDYIVTTLPYDEDIPGWQRETLYVGPRTGYYKYTERFDDEEAASAIFKKNKEMYDLPIDFSTSNTRQQRDMVLQKMAEDRGMYNANLSGTTIKYNAKSSEDAFVTTRDDAGVVIQTSYDSNIMDPTYRHYIILEMKDNRSKEIVDMGKTYTIIYNMDDPRDLIGVARQGERIDQGVCIGYGTEIKQEFFTASMPDMRASSAWKRFNMVDKNISYNMNQFVNSNMEPVSDWITLGIPVSSKNMVKTRPTASQKEAAKYTINIKNPDHLIDGEGNPAPGYMPVINYHWIDSRHDIIENAITATAESLHNKVTIRYPNEPGAGSDNEFEVIADDNIKSGNIRHLVVHQANVDSSPFEDFTNLVLNNPLRAVPTVGVLPSKYTVSSNILANEMRKMYGGYIKIWGRPSIKPYDIVYMNDLNSQMFGPIEVAEVIHDFNTESGFTTTIIPHAVITIRNQDKVYHDIALNGLIVPYFNTKFYNLVSYAVDPLALLAGAALGSSVGIPEKAAIKVFGEGGEVAQRAAQNIGQTELNIIKSGGRLGLGAVGAILRKTPFVGKHIGAIGEAAKKMGTLLYDGAKVTAGVVPKGKTLDAITKGSMLAKGYLGETLFAIPQITALSACGIVWGKSINKVMGRDIINVTGLWYNGNPLTAGMEGAYKDSYRTHFMDYVSSLFTFSTGQEFWKGSSEGQGQ